MITVNNVGTGMKQIATSVPAITICGDNKTIDVTNTVRWDHLVRDGEDSTYKRQPPITLPVVTTDTVSCVTLIVCGVN